MSVVLSDSILTSLSVGATLSKSQLNCVDTRLLFPTVSVNVFAATSIVQAPCPDGVKVAV